MAQTKRHLICIASPVRRSGTTLVQRLLCSSPSALIYGESCANDFQLQLSLFSNKQMLLQQSKDWHNEQVKMVLQGEVNKWIPDLMPEINGYLDAYKNMIISLADHYQSYAKQHGRSIWGMKMPEWNPTGLILMRNLFPETKIIYLHRKLEDCVRSAKKIDMIRDTHEVQRFCHTWKQFGDYARQHLSDDRVLHLHYEDLVADADLWISKLEDFTGVREIDRSVMNIKVNTFDNDPKLQAEQEAYLPPAELTDDELTIISNYTSVSMDTL